jgi:hypothetical protein
MEPPRTHQSGALIHYDGTLLNDYTSIIYSESRLAFS